MRTKLKNMAHATFSRNGLALTRAAFASAVSSSRLMKRDDLPGADLLVLRSGLLKKELDYQYLEDRLYNRKLRALNAAA